MAMATIRRLWVVAFACAMAFCLAYAGQAFAADDLAPGAADALSAGDLQLETQATNYNLWVAGKRVTSANAKDVLGDGHVSYSAKTNTLTLKNAKITKAYLKKTTIDDIARYYNFGIYSAMSDGLTIKLVGTNTISMPTKNSPLENVCISAKGKLTLSGAGTLKATANKAQLFSIGIYADTLVLQNSVKVTAKGASTKITDTKHLTSVDTHGGYGIAVTTKLYMKGTAQLTVYGPKCGIYKNFNPTISFGSSYTPQVKAGTSSSNIKVNKKSPAKSVYTKYKYVKITKAAATTIKPDKLTISSATGIKNGVKIQFKTPAKYCNYYQVQVFLSNDTSNSKEFDSGYKSTVTNCNMTYKYTSDNMGDGVTYYLRVRAIYKTDSKTYTGAWSALKKVVSGA